MSIDTQKAIQNNQGNSNDSKNMSTCRHCLSSFNVATNNPRACRFHPEVFSGETAQRWLPPGETKGGGVVHNFWSCCGSYDEKALGCCYTSHSKFGDNDDYTLRRPGMGVEDS